MSLSTSGALEAGAIAEARKAVDKIEASAIVLAGEGGAVINGDLAESTLKPGPGAVAAEGGPIRLPEAAPIVEAAPLRGAVELELLAGWAHIPLGLIAVAREAVHTVLARPIVLAGLKPAQVDVILAPITGEVSAALAHDLVHPIKACPVVLALLELAVIHVLVAQEALPPGPARAGEVPLPINARGTVLAGIREALVQLLAGGAI